MGWFLDQMGFFWDFVHQQFLYHRSLRDVGWLGREDDSETNILPDSHLLIKVFLCAKLCDFFPMPVSTCLSGRESIETPFSASLLDLDYIFSLSSSHTKYISGWVEYQWDETFYFFPLPIRNPATCLELFFLRAAAFVHLSLQKGGWLGMRELIGYEGVDIHTCLFIRGVVFPRAILWMQDNKWKGSLSRINCVWRNCSWGGLSSFFSRPLMRPARGVSMDFWFDLTGSGWWCGWGLDWSVRGAWRNAPIGCCIGWLVPRWNLWRRFFFCLVGKFGNGGLILSGVESFY